MSMVIWSFLDLYSSYSGRSTSPRHAVSVAQGRDAVEELDPNEEDEDVACHGDSAVGAPIPCETVRTVVVE